MALNLLTSFIVVAFISLAYALRGCERCRDVPNRYLNAATSSQKKSGLVSCSAINLGIVEGANCLDCVFDAMLNHYGTCSDQTCK